MLEVKPIQSKEDQKDFCERCGAAYDADLLAYSLFDGDRLIGVCQFKMTPDGGSIRSLDLTEEKFDLIYMLCAGTLNFIELCGALYAYLDFEITPTKAKLLGFEPNENGRYRIDLKKFFSNPCKCHK